MELVITFKRGDFVFYADGQLVESQANERAFLEMMDECQAIEDHGPVCESERALLICEEMIKCGFLHPKDWAE